MIYIDEIVEAIEIETQMEVVIFQVMSDKDIDLTKLSFVTIL